MNQIPALSFSQFTALDPQSDSAVARPVSTDKPLDCASSLKQHLLDLSKQAENKPFSSILRAAAASVRELAFGYNRDVTKKRILKLLGEFDLCEMDDFLDELDLPKKEISGALDDLIAEGKIETGQRRRWQELGEHYNTTYFLKK